MLGPKPCGWSFSLKVSMRVSHPCGGASPAIRVWGGILDALGFTDRWTWILPQLDETGVFSHPAGPLERRTSCSENWGCQEASADQGLNPGMGAAECGEERTCPAGQAWAACASFLQVPQVRAAGPKKRWFGLGCICFWKDAQSCESENYKVGLDFKAACIVYNDTVPKHFVFSHGGLTRKLKRGLKRGTARRRSSEGWWVYPNRARAKAGTLVKKQMHGVPVEQLWACTNEETFPCLIWTM